jgi:hypothetical protein
MSKYRRIDISRIRPVSIQSRPSKLNSSMLGRPVQNSGDLSAFFESLPDVLKAADFRSLVKHIINARGKNKPILLMMGAHVIKTGLSPILIDLMHLGYIQGIAMNGAGAIHDMELAYFGKTSEDVADLLKDGRFGMARETGELLNNSTDGNKNDLGFGELLGARIVRDHPKFAEFSLLGQAYERDIPVTIHVALGTDIVHQHPTADGAFIGEHSLRDFHIFCELVSGIGNGGVVLLFGSAVVLPEVFLKALTVARNIHGEINNFVTAAFDMNRHYRPEMNLVERPTREGGNGYSFTGHHEIMIPLLAAAVKAAQVNRL